AQYGYYDAYGNPIAYPADYYDMYGNPYPPPYTGGYGFGGPDPIAQQMAALQQQVDAQLLQAMRPFIDYYRQATGDQQTPDELAGQYGMDLWCKDHPVECERAQAQSAQDSAWLAQSNAAFQ